MKEILISLFKKGYINPESERILIQHRTYRLMGVLFVFLVCFGVHEVEFTKRVKIQTYLNLIKSGVDNRELRCMINDFPGCP